MPAPKNKSRNDNPILKPGFKRVTPPGNKGKPWPSEILKRTEIRQLFEAYGDAAGSVRDFAMVTLMYRAGFRMHQLLALERRHFNPGDHQITAPAWRGTPEGQIALDRDSREAMERWMIVRRELGVPVNAPLFCTISKPNIGGKLGDAAVREMLKTRAARAGIDRRVHPQGIRDSGIKHRQASRDKVLAQVGPYIDTEGLQGRHPDAYEQWEAAVELHRRKPDANAKLVGQACRDAIRSFVDDAAEARDIKLPSHKEPVQRLRFLLRALVSADGDLPHHASSLVEYWGAADRLANRQVHSDDRGGGTLLPFDGERLIFHTLVVMLDVDRILPELPVERAQAKKKRRA